MVAIKTIFFIILIPLIISIITMLKKNPEFKKFIEELKGELTGNTAGSSRPAPRPLGNPQVKQQRPASALKVEYTPTEGEGSMEGVGTEGYTGGLVYNRMESQLKQLDVSIFDTMKSRNEIIEMEEKGHKHPAEGYAFEKVDAYSGSLGTDYAGEGCREHYYLRFISNEGQSDNEVLQLNELQKIIVFGEMLNSPRYRKRALK